MTKDSFILYKQHFKQIELLTMEERGQLLTAILRHVNGEEPQAIERTVQLLLGPIRERIDVDTAKYKEICEKRAENGKKGAEFGKLGAEHGKKGAEFGKLGGRPIKYKDYDDILNGAYLSAAIINKLKGFIKHCHLNKYKLKNNELEKVINKLYELADDSIKAKYIECLTWKTADEIANFFNEE